MLGMISEEGKDDLLARGYSRRQMMRAAMMFGGAAATALTPWQLFRRRQTQQDLTKH